VGGFDCGDFKETTTALALSEAVRPIMPQMLPQTLSLNQNMLETTIDDSAEIARKNREIATPSRHFL
jgi:hypothetical protein